MRILIIDARRSRVGRSRCVALAIGFVALLAGCGGGGGGYGSGGGDGPLVVATTTQLGDLARNVAGDRARVRTLLAPNTDPHDYEPRPSAAQDLADAKLILRSGGEVDDWLGDLAEGAGAHEPVDVSESLSDVGDDPHWWHDPRNAAVAVEAIAAALAEADPDGRAGYERNARAYAERIRRADGAIARCMDEVPAAERKLVTTHDALGHFARRYGVTAIGSVIPSLSTEAQPSAADADRLVDQIRGEGVKVVFAESSVSSELERAIAEEGGAKVGEPLWADTLGPEGSSGATYLDSLAWNANAMIEGFSGGRARCRVEV
jgi:zinc/manganese transport system substrate-binding protein/manganese/iron transport system substrate-binding protein